MTTLHFNTDAGRQAASMMGNCRSNVEAEINNLKSYVNSLVPGDWQGNSAVQFQNEFQTWEGQLRTYLDALSNLQNRLNSEIAAWEATAAQLSG